MLGRMEIHWSRTRFLLAVARGDRVPDPGLPQLVVVGHSNVGKSSLLNALLARRNLLRTSKKPGCTRLINVFDVDGSLLLMDLPGYGFAHAGKRERRSWRGMVESFLLQKVTARRLVLVLLDARHGPKPADLQLIEWLQAQGLRWRPVATKMDKLTAQEQARRRREMRDALGGAVDPLPTSSSKGMGIDVLRGVIVEELWA